MALGINLRRGGARDRVDRGFLAGGRSERVCYRFPLGRQSLDNCRIMIFFSPT
jgi:hypothetical protein